MPAALPAKRIDVQRALKLRIQGNSFSEIAAILDCSPQAVEQRLDGFKKMLQDITDVGQLQAYTEERKALLNAAEMKLLSSILEDKAIDKAPLAARTMAFGVLYDKRRLEEGKSTENLGILGKLLIESEQELGKTERVATVETREQKGNKPRIEPENTPSNSLISGHVDNLSEESDQ